MAGRHARSGMPGCCRGATVRRGAANAVARTRGTCYNQPPERQRFSVQRAAYAVSEEAGITEMEAAGWALAPQENEGVGEVCVGRSPRCGRDGGEWRGRQALSFPLKRWCAANSPA